MDLQEARNKIDAIDTILANTYAERLKIVLDIAKYKDEHHLPITDASRDREIVKKQSDACTDESIKVYIEEYLESVIAISNKFLKNHMRQHIFLIGMPGAGKTTVGKALAQEQGLEFFDVDAEIQEKTGKSIQNIIIHDGEDTFRQYEYDVISAIIADKNPSVIATGGGTVLSEKTVQLMRENGFVVFIHRNVKQILDDLDMEIRPLLKESIEYIFRLYEERYPLYEKVGHIKIENSSNVSDTVAAIVKALPMSES